MTKYLPVEISEHQLEDLIRQEPEYIEKGLKFIDHQTFTSRGPLDVIFIDSGHALVITELKIIEDDGMLVQGIDYYDYILRNLEGFARGYARHEIDTKQQPRLFLVAPSFSVTMINRIKWIDIPISLFEFQCIEMESNKGEILPVFKEVSIPEISVMPEVYSLEDRIKYITDTKIKELVRSFIAECQIWDSQRVLIEPTKYDISMKVSGRVFAYLAPRRKYFMIYTNDPEGKWTGYPIHSDNDIESVKLLVRENFNKLK